RKWCGEDTPKVAASLNNLANSLRQAGQLAEAEQLSRRVVALAQKLWGEQHWRVPISRKNLGIILRRRGAAEGDTARLREALFLNPTDALTADAFAAAAARPSLKALVPAWSPEPPPWRFTCEAPGPEWTSLNFAAAAWRTSPAPRGSPLALPRTNRIPPPINTTNLWLRREFD